MAYFFVWKSIKNLNLFVGFVEIWYTKIKEVWFEGIMEKISKKSIVLIILLSLLAPLKAIG